MKSLILIVGMPGAGKDTQIDLLKKIKPFEVIKVGDLVRERAKTDSEIAKVLDAGELVDNDIVDNMISDKISTFPEGSIIISDGFPRDLPQAQWIEDYASKNNLKILKFIYLDIPDEESVARLLKRGRNDDNQETIDNRIKIFHKRTNPVLDFFKSYDFYEEVDGVGSVEEIHKRIMGALNW
jgi:adenylate kinase